MPTGTARKRRRIDELVADAGKHDEQQQQQGRRLSVGDTAEARCITTTTTTKGNGGSGNEHEFRACTILDERRASDHTRMLYVHYKHSDKRLDTWLNESDVRALSASTAAALSPASSTSAVGLSRRTRLSMAPQDGLEIAVGSGNVDVPSATGEMAGVEGTSGTARAAAEGEEHEHLTRIRNVQQIELGTFLVNTWYFSPFPQEYGQCEKLYICEFCLKYMRKARSLERHQLQACSLRHPPGNEIYRKHNLSVFEVDGRHQKLYCQNLCLLAKLFLDHKTLYFDVAPFLFYVLTEVDNNGAHIVGYFSKEKHSADDFNVACILVFPQHQRKGFGKFLVQLSYALTAREGKTGSPEKPLSDLGKVTYRSYWTWTLLNLLRENPVMSVDQLSEKTGFKHEDIVNTLKALDMIRYYKGDHVVHVSSKRVETHLQQVADGFQALRFDDAYLDWHDPKKKSRRS